MKEEENVSSAQTEIDYGWAEKDDDDLAHLSFLFIIHLLGWGSDGGGFRREISRQTHVILMEVKKSNILIYS